MRIRNLAVAVLITLSSAAFGGVAFANDEVAAQSFVQQEHSKLENLLRQPASVTRDSAVTNTLEKTIDYAEIARRAYGEPCPASIPGCKDWWTTFTPEQKDQVTALLRKVVEKNYRKNLIKTLDYDVTYKGVRDAGPSQSKIRTEAKSKLKPRDPPVQIDYVVHSGNAGHHIVDIVTEGSSLTKNYYDQFNRMLSNPAQGYPYMVSKLEKSGMPNVK